MRHQKKTVKLGRTAEHRKALFANQVCSLIEHSRIKTTLAKAKALRPFAEKMVTLGKSGSLHDRRNAISYLRQPNMVKILFEEVAPRSANRAGGYTRIIKLGPRLSDSAPMAFIEWVDAAAPSDDLAVKPASKAPVEKKDRVAKPVAQEGGATAPKKRGSVGSRKKSDKAKRAAAKVKRQTTTAVRKAKPKVGGTRLKNRKTT